MDCGKAWMDHEQGLRAEKNEGGKERSKLSMDSDLIEHDGAKW